MPFFSSCTSICTEDAAPLPLVVVFVFVLVLLLLLALFITLLVRIDFLQSI